MRGFIPLKGLLSKLYGSGVCFRHFLYDKKILAAKKAPLPVVSIGNVVVGGAGKTQATLLLVEALRKEMQVAVLSRGYKGKAEHAKTPLLVRQETPPAISGDEPAILASRLQNAFIVVNKKRLNSAFFAEKLGAKLLVLDDGMQHRELHKDFEIVIIDGKAPLDDFLPKGNLREDLHRLSRTDLILFVGKPTEHVLQKVLQHTSAPYAVVTIAPEGLFYLDGKGSPPLAGKKIAAFCGIGDPARFVRTLEHLGAFVVASHFSKDHEIPSKKALYAFGLQAKSAGAEFLVCTEKDKVKLPQAQLGTDFPLPIVWLKTALQVASHGETWEKALATIKSLALSAGRNCR